MAVTEPTVLANRPAPDAPAALELRGVHQAYERAGERIDVLDGADLEVRAGELVAVVGRSGSGKSTLLHVLGCLDRPDAGKYELDGVETTALDDDALAALRCKRIGFV
ncbi:MAG: ATP-binding cassette domain-containing protein, partial [Actinomycetota bacterium]